MVRSIGDHLFKPNFKTNVAKTFSLPSPLAKTSDDFPLCRDILINHLCYIDGKGDVGEHRSRCSAENSYFVRKELSMLELHRQFFLQELPQFMAKQSPRCARLIYRANNSGELKSQIVIQTSNQLFLCFVSHLSLLPIVFLWMLQAKPNTTVRTESTV